jgi:hypothetical protein
MVVSSTMTPTRSGTRQSSEGFPVPGSKPEPIEQLISGVALDGNSVSVAEVQLLSDGRLSVTAANQIENNDMIEKIVPFRHPIHQTVHGIEYPQLEKLVQQLNELLSLCPQSSGSVITLPEDVINRFEEKLNGTPEHQHYIRGLKKVYHPNPYGFPLLLAHNRTQDAALGRFMQFWSVRFEDFLHTAELFYPINKRFFGAVTGHRSLMGLLPKVLAIRKDQPQITIHLGKLRTTYVGMLNGKVLFAHTIPVGMSRDGAHYFETLFPNVHRIGQLVNDLGTLILPADTTPTRIFNRDLLSPQSEATRFAHQIGEFALKTRRDYFHKFSDEHVHFHLSGTVSRLKGLLEYLVAKTNLQFDYLRNNLNDQLVYTDTMDCCVTDYFPAIGSCLAYKERHDSRLGMILTDHRPKSLRSINLDIDALKPGALYAVQFPQESGGSGFTPPPTRKK